MIQQVKYLFGSKMLKLNNCRDEDWLIFIEKHPKGERQKGVRSIALYNRIIEHFIEGKNQPNDYYKSCIIYQLSRGFQEGDENYPFNHFNILEHREVWVKQLKNYMNHDTTEALAFKGDVLPKLFYHILYQYYMITEGVHYISDEAKVNVQKIHDYEMPSTYFYELRDKINSL